MPLVYIKVDLVNKYTDIGLLLNTKYGMFFLADNSSEFYNHINQEEAFLSGRCSRS